MEEKLDLLFLDNSNILIEEISINKPNDFNELLDIIKNKFNKLPNNYNIYYRKDNNIEIINNNENYKSVKDILFIHEVGDLEKSIFTMNYNKLSDSKQAILNDKYECIICETFIKIIGEDNNDNIINDKPVICYQCQQIYHKKCLEGWNKECNLKQINFNCPKCKYELPLKDWKEKINYKEERNNEANIMDELNKNKLKENINNYIINIKTNKFNELKNKFDIYVENTSKILKNIFEINKMIDYGHKIDNNKDKIELNNLYKIPEEIFECLKNIENFVKEKKNINYQKLDNDNDYDDKKKRNNKL